MKRRALMLAALAVGLAWLFIDDAHARPGGGHSYSGGSSSSSGGDDVAGLVWLLLRLIIYWPEVGIPVAIVVLIGVVWVKRHNGALGDWDSGQSIASSAPRPSLDSLRQLDPQFSEVLFRDFAYALYSRAHRARTDPQALAKLAPYLGPPARQALAQRLPVGDPVVTVVIGAARVVALSLPRTGVPGADARVTLHIESNITVGHEGARRAFFVHERWTFARAAGATTRPTDRARAFRCPNCDADFESADGTHCSYCGEVVNNGRFDWVVTAAVLLHSEPRPPALTEHARERGTSLQTVLQPGLAEHLAALRAELPQFDETALHQRLALAFGRLNAAWSGLDLAPARPFVSDGMHQYLGYWVNAYRQEGLRNVADDARLDRSTIVKVVRDAHYVSVTLRLWASALDYTVDERSGKVVGGSRRSRREYTEYWTLIRSVGAQGPARAHARCPSCAADLSINMGGNCEFCGAHVTAGEFDWVLARIEQDEAYTG